MRIFHIGRLSADISHSKATKTDINAPEFVAAEKAVQARIDKLFAINGTETVDSIHKELGHIMWDYVGMARDEEGLKSAIAQIKALRERFYKEVKVPGTQFEFNQELEKALRLEDFFDIGELMAYDALNRKESCGGHFRVESQTETTNFLPVLYPVQSLYLQNRSEAVPCHSQDPPETI